jgi:DNA-binding CsgD family transcriptional regulator
VLWELGSAETHAGEAAGIGHLAEAMESGGSAETTSGAALILGRALMLVNQPGPAIEVFDRAAVVLAGDEQLGLLFEGALVGTAQLDSAAARSVQGHVARLERRLESGTVPRAVAAVCAVRAAMTNAPAERAAALARRALDGAERPWPGPGDPNLFFHGCAALLWAERWDEVEAFLRASLRDAQALGSVPRFAAACNFLGVHAFRLGRLADAEADARLPLEGGGLEELSWYEPSLLATLIDTLVERGDPEAAARAEADGRAEDLLNRTSLGATLLLGARGRLRIAQGRLQEGLDDLLASGARLEGMDAVSPCMASWRSDAAVAHLARGEEDEARALAARDLELARAFGASRVLGVALRTAGLAQGGDAGVALLAESPRALAGSPARLELARSRIELGAALRRRGRRREARTELRAGLDLAHRCAAEPLAARAHEELLATGARPRRPVLTGVDALTPSERRIVELAAAGATNREIAQSLFVTARTVESHLTQAYRKLRVTSRDELGAALAP